MRRLVTAAALSLAFGGLMASSAWAGSPHFVSNTVTATRTGNSLTVSGKEAGLGDEAQVHIVVSATAACINPGQNHPKAANKQAAAQKVNPRTIAEALRRRSTPPSS